VPWGVLLLVSNWIGRRWGCLGRQLNEGFFPRSGGWGFFCLRWRFGCSCLFGLSLFCYWSISVRPCAGQALTFFAAAKKVSKESGLKPLTPEKQSG
jgi:hypothetical protein